MHDLLEGRRQVGDRAPTNVAINVRSDFPLLNACHGDRPLIWLDNAATTQKPRVVIDRLTHFYERENANVHRAGHALGAAATEAFESARDTVRRFVNAGDRREIVFVRGTTEAINLVAQSWGHAHVDAADEIVVSALEHHSNLVPWQALATRRRARLRLLPLDRRGELDLGALDRLLTARTRLVAITHISNAFGTVVPVAEIVERAHGMGAAVLIDGAQAVSHVKIDVQALDADFYAFSGHKVFGPTGIGVLYGKAERLAETAPWQVGGSTVDDVEFEGSTFRDAPYKFEAGTPNVAGAIALATALEYLDGIGLGRVEQHDAALTAYAARALASIPRVRQVGAADHRLGVISFVVDGIRSADVAEALDAEGIAVRVGHHCALPALRALGVDSVVRASLAVYNTTDDIDALTRSLARILDGARLTK